MVPGVIVKETLSRRLDAIGICDHNATENVSAVRKAAQKKNITVLRGIEITSEEEVHILAFFDEDESLFEMQRMIYKNLPGVNDEKAFGEQVVVDENDQVVDVNDRLLIGAAGLPLGFIVEAIRSLSGLVVASHVDRQSFGIIGQLGFIPEGLPLDALEISPRMPVRQARATLPGVSGFPVVTFSDAHHPEDIGKRWTRFRVEEMRVEEVRKALLGQEGRATSVIE